MVTPAICSQSPALQRPQCFSSQHAAQRLKHSALPAPFTPHTRHAQHVQTIAAVSSQGPASSSDSASSSKRHMLLAGLAAAAASLAGTPAAEAKQSSSDWSSPGLAAPEDTAAPKFFKTPSGVKVQEMVAGSSGPEVQAGDAVLVDYVLRRSNGYFIYGTQEGVSFQPKDVPVGPVILKLGSGDCVPGLEEALFGMRQGGKRRVLVPPEQGYTTAVGGAELQPQPPTFATKRQLANHAREPLLFEIEVLRVNRPSR